MTLPVDRLLVDLIDLLSMMNSIDHCFRFVDEDLPTTAQQLSMFSIGDSMAMVRKNGIHWYSLQVHLWMLATMIVLTLLDRTRPFFLFLVSHCSLDEINGLMSTYRRSIQHVQ
jgi:hypothetical protein